MIIKIVMDFQDFMQQAETDLVSSTTAFNNEDFPNSAFYSQQAFEKYLKAYLLKFKIINDPIKANHLAYPHIFSVLISKCEETETSINSSTKQHGIEFLKKLSKLVEKIETNKQLKIMMWKISLEIPLTIDEENYDVELGSKIIPLMDNVMKENYGELANIIPSWMKKDFQKNDLSHTTPAKNKSTKINKNDELLAKRLISLVENTLKTLSSSSVDEANKNSEKIYDDLNILLEIGGYGAGKGSLSKKFTEYTMTTMIINRTFYWLDIGIQIFPHESISRYPNTVDGELTTELYEKYSSNLKKLLEKVQTTCNEIRQEIKKN